jgi:hypothetical protein
MQAAYPHLLITHSWVRWAVLVLLVTVVVRAWRGRRARNAVWSPVDERCHAALVGVADLQMLLGLVLYAVSPFARAFLADPIANQKVRILRFFGEEHIVAMVVAIALLHVGRTRSQRVADVTQRHRRVFAWTLAALILVLLSIPWPYFPIERPLFRFGF